MIYQVQDPQGKIHEIEGPEGATQEQVMAQAQALIPSGQGGGAPPSATPYQDIWSQPDKGVLSKAWESLDVPERTAKKVLGGIASQVPEGEVTGNMAGDLARGTPRILANTMAEALPGFVSKASILTAGAAGALQAMRPVGSVVGKGVAGQLESATGANPGSLSRAWNDPSLIFAKGKQAATPIYEAGKMGGKTAKALRGIPLKDDFIDVASKLADEGKLPPETALEARKIAGKLFSKGGGKYTPDYLRDLIGKFDGVAKSNQAISKGDAIYQRGIDAASLRSILPQNKYGGTSAFKMGLMALFGPSYAGALSPAVHGAVATAGGLVARVATNPPAAVTANQLYSTYIDRIIDGKQQIK